MFFCGYETSLKMSTHPKIIYKILIKPIKILIVGLIGAIEKTKLIISNSVLSKLHDGYERQHQLRRGFIT